MQCKDNKSNRAELVRGLPRKNTCHSTSRVRFTFPFGSIVPLAYQISSKNNSPPYVHPLLMIVNQLLQRHPVDPILGLIPLHQLLIHVNIEQQILHIEIRQILPCPVLSQTCLLELLNYNCICSIGFGAEGMRKGRDRRLGRSESGDPLHLPSSPRPPSEVLSDLYYTHVT
jgi:hypothetical protein